jgi:hypothetical protein
MTAPIRCYLSDSDYALLDAAQLRLDQDRRYQAIRDEIDAVNAAQWDAHTSSAIYVARNLSDPTSIPDPLDPEPADEPESLGSLLACVREVFVLAGTLLVRAVWPRRWVR